jgi:3',5'-cyclic AMP phosphodiesterase CpdA
MALASDAPAEGTLTMSFTIAHITDPHLSPAPMPGFSDLRLKRVMGFINWKRGRERLNDMGMLKRLVDDLRAQRPDHVAVTGDLVNIGMAAEFQRAALWMETLGEPADVSFVPGNHDAYVRASMPVLESTFAPWARSDGAQGNKATYPYLRVRGEIAIIGLSSAVPTAPLMATGRLGKKQVEAFAELLRQTGAKALARVVLIHHPPLTGAPPLRGLSDAVAFERVVRDFGAEAILHGHIHRQAVRSLPSRAARTVTGAVPVLSAPSAAAAASHPRYRAAYHLVRLDRDGERWRVGARARGLHMESAAIVEREGLGV